MHGNNVAEKMLVPSAFCPKAPLLSSGRSRVFLSQYMQSNLFSFPVRIFNLRALGKLAQLQVWATRIQGPSHQPHLQRRAAVSLILSCRIHPPKITTDKQSKQAPFHPLCSAFAICSTTIRSCKSIIWQSQSQKSSDS